MERTSMITLSHCNNLFLCLSFLLDNKLLKPRTVPWSSQLPAQCLAQNKCSKLVCGMNVWAVATWPLCVLQMPLRIRVLDSGVREPVEDRSISCFIWRIFLLKTSVVIWRGSLQDRVTVSLDQTWGNHSHALNAQVSEPSVTALSFFPGILANVWKRQTRNTKFYGFVLLLAWHSKAQDYLSLCPATSIGRPTPWTSTTEAGGFLASLPAGEKKGSDLTSCLFSTYSFFNKRNSWSR